MDFDKLSFHHSSIAIWILGLRPASGQIDFRQNILISAYNSVN